MVKICLVSKGMAVLIHSKKLKKTGENLILVHKRQFVPIFNRRSVSGKIEKNLLTQKKYLPEQRKSNIILMPESIHA